LLVIDLEGWFWHLNWFWFKVISDLL